MSKETFIKYGVIKGETKEQPVKTASDELSEVVVSQDSKDEESESTD